MTTKPNPASSTGVSSAARSFPGLGDVILSSAAGKGSDGDETAAGSEVNDGDADDMPASSPSVNIAEDGTYRVGMHV